MRRCFKVKREKAMLAKRNKGGEAKLNEYCAASCTWHEKLKVAKAQVTLVKLQMADTGAELEKIASKATLTIPDLQARMSVVMKMLSALE